jgi:hypothetical protein
MPAVMPSNSPARDRRTCPMICGELMCVLVVFDLVDQRRAPLPRLPMRENPGEVRESSDHLMCHVRPLLGYQADERQRALVHDGNGRQQYPDTAAR